MVVRVMGGYDTATGWPPDDSTGVEWDPDVDIPGKFKGGGAGFGPGGFPGNPRMVAPASGSPPGVSLSGAGGGGDFDPAAEVPFGERGHPFIGPKWGGGPPPENFPNISSILRGGARFLPKVIGKRIPFVDMVTPSDELAAPTGVELPRTLGRSPSGPGFPDQTPKLPTPQGYPPVDYPPGRLGDQPPVSSYRPEDDPRFTAPNPYGAGMPRPGPSDPPAVLPAGHPAARAPLPRRRPVAAPVAAPAQSPWITTDYRQNRDMAGGARGQSRQQDQQGMLDLSKLFGRR